jgi:hypothetical protein
MEDIENITDDDTAQLGDDDQSGTENAVRECLDLETQKRLWVRTLIPLLRMRSHDSDPSCRVQLAYDLMHIAVCERIRLMLHVSSPEQS